MNEVTWWKSRGIRGCLPTYGFLHIYFSSAFKHISCFQKLNAIIMEQKGDSQTLSSQEESADLILPFGVNKDNLTELVDLAKDFAIFKGTCIRTSSCKDARIPIPFSLLPSPFPKEWFTLAKSIQEDMNYVLHKISYSPEFLKSCLKNVLEADEFMAQIFKIHETVLAEGILQPISLGLLRCDYLLDTDETGTVTGIKQVESNTISTSNSAITTNVHDMHKLILNRLGIQHLDKKLPENNAKAVVAEAIVLAWTAYGNNSALILLIIEDVTINICDQRALEFAIYELEPGIQVLRHTFSELRGNLSLRNGRLFICEKEIALAYYRSGYIPSHYEPKDWETRLLIEKSFAIKCPTAGYHLAGTKRVQLELSRPGVLEKFLPENSDAQRIRQMFAGQFLLDAGEEGDKSVALTLENPYKFVLKPEREGGGNNMYGDDIRSILSSIQPEARQAYILMEKMNPPKVPNCLVRSSSDPKIANIVCELGIYGIIIGTKDKILENKEAGHIIKGKEFGLDEGGIVAGFGVVSSPYLV